MIWLCAAIGAAMIWGLSYAVSGHVLKSGFSPSFMMVSYAMVTFPIFFGLAWVNGDLLKGIQALRAQPTMIPWFVFVPLTQVIGAFLILWAIKQKNATAVSLIEISYPLFVALFAWILFRDGQLNWGMAGGAALIATGIALVARFS
jgi:drug/metabolite transporter (DMT)-like permease